MSEVVLIYSDQDQERDKTHKDYSDRKDLETQKLKKENEYFQNLMQEITVNS